MRNWIIEFYCLPYRDLIALFGVITYAFLSLNRRFRDNRLWKALIFGATVLWIGVILRFTVSTRETASINLLFLSPFHSYREMAATGNIEILRSNFMNVILFYPGGLMTASLLPKTWPRWVNILLPFLFFLLFSAGIEWFQYATCSGRAEIDDVLHNTLGALLGGIFGVIPPPKRGWTRKSRFV